MSSDFVHLHCHSEYSLLDGANRLEDLVRRAQELEMPALALTDHGSMFGAWAFHKMARKGGVNPIVGMEAYVAPGSRHDRERIQGEKGYYHLVMLARDLQGYRNLAKLSSIGYTEGFYGKPRIDREVIASHSEGIIVTSACLAGEIAQHLLADRWDEARSAASWYANLFDGRFYLEVQAHDSEGQAILNAKIFRLAEELGIPVVATNDAHFLSAEDHPAHDVLLCIGMGKDHDDPNRMRYDEGLYFKSAEEMRTRFPERPDVLENTLAIASQVDLHFEKKYHVPAFPLPPDVPTEDDLLRNLAYAGAAEVYPEPLTEAVRERLDYEIGVITNLGYSGYFLILQDVIRWCREQDIPVGPGRGSAAGSIVAYTLGITDICPLEHDLLFERFLNPDRATMPDIDTDFAREGRQDAIAYVRKRYGEEAVVQIITFGTLGAKGVLKDVGRTLGFGAGEMNKLTARIPQGFTLEQAVSQVPELGRMADSGTRSERDLVDFSRRLEGLVRNSSIHAGGVVIAPGPVEEYLPISTQKSAGGRRLKVTQYDMNAVEEAGLLKFDFLGIKTLDQRDYTREMIRERHGVVIAFDQREEKRGRERWGSDHEIRRVSIEDPSIYDLLRAGRTAGVFQFESALATDKLRLMRADRFDDLVATNALIRPGPLDMGMDAVYIRRKLGQEEVSFPHPDLAAVLEPTYGVIVYQEQVMRIAQILAGYTLAEADVLRKAVGKKDAALIHEELGRFVRKAVEKGRERSMVETLAEQIEAFGRYGFNKSHSAAYSLLSVHCAYLKANYPAEFLAGILSFEEQIPVYLAEARELGIRVLPPSVNESKIRFNVVDRVEGAAIRFGFGGIKNVGGIAAGIITEREENGPYSSFFDFVARCQPLGLNRRSLEALIDTGACDDFGHRAQLLHATSQALSYAQTLSSDRQKGQVSLFDVLAEAAGTDPSAAEPSLPDVPRMPPLIELAKERELMGFYVSGHPMATHEADAESIRSRRIRLPDEGRPEGLATLVGMVTETGSAIAKKSQKPWGWATIEDLSGAQKIKMFGDTWKQFGHKLRDGAVVMVRGRYQDEDPNDETPDFFADEVDPLEVAISVVARERVLDEAASARQSRAEERLASGSSRESPENLEEPSIQEEDVTEAGEDPEEIVLRLRLPKPLIKGDALAERIRRTLDAYPGDTPVEFAVRDGEFRMARTRVCIQEEILEELRSLIGEEEVFLHPAPEGRRFALR